MIESEGDYYIVNGAQIHTTANIVGDVEIGKGSRIDAFVTITGKTRIGRHTHLGVGACVFGGGGVEIGDYVGISPGVKVFSATEDPSGDWITNPTVGPDLRNPKVERIYIGDHCLIGANAVILPGAYLSEGVCMGALSLCKSRLDGWSLWAGSPVKFIRERTSRAKDLINNAPANREKAA